MNSFSGLIAIGLIFMPGVLYASAFEATVGPWRIGLSDRLLRFVSISVFFHVLLLPLTYYFWARFGASGRVEAGRPLPLFLWPMAIAYVGPPFVLGVAVGKATRGKKSWAWLFTGPDPAPRAWDHLFSSAPDGWLRLKLKSGAWIGGAYAKKDGQMSYASGYPESGDLFLAEAVEVNPVTGEIILDDEGHPHSLDSGLLVRWEEVEYLEFEESAL